MHLFLHKMIFHFQVSKRDFTCECYTENLLDYKAIRVIEALK